MSETGPLQGVALPRISISMKKPLYLLFILIAGTGLASAQIQWADRLLSYSSQRGEIAYSAKQVLGPPSKLPALGDCGCAWVPKLPDNNQEEFVRVAFKEKIQVERIYVSENHNAGAIKEILLFDQYNVAHSVYVRPQVEPQYGRMLVIDIPRTSFVTSDLKLILDTESVPGFNQIDAIGISSGKVPYQMPEVPLTDYFQFIGDAENPGAIINSPGSDIAPILSDDGKRLYFTRKDHPGNTGNVLNDDIWYADISGKALSTAVNPGAPINNSYNNYVIGTSNNGKLLSLANAYYPDGRRSMGVAQTWQNEDTWRYPLNLFTPGLISYNFYAEYFVNTDRTVMLVSLEKADGLGMKDIYVCFSSNQLQWTPPMHLGNVINTSGNEMAPSLSPDGKYLFFASDGLPGYGEMDIYIAERLDDTWLKWGTPKNLGPKINSDGFDAYFTYNDSCSYAYFTSTRDAYFNPDIYRIQIAPVLHEEEEIVTEASTEKESVQPLYTTDTPSEPVVLTNDLLLFGTVFDEATELPIEATVIFEVADFSYPPDSINTLNKNYRKKITDNITYKVIVISDGYLYHEELVEIAEVNEQKVKRIDFRLTPAKKGESFRLDNLQFRANSYVIKSESWEELDELAIFMRNNSKLRVEIGGHTNGLCDDEYCNNLSRQRAEAVKTYLQEKGIDASRIEAVGYGKSRPIASDDTPEGRSLNQRVEVTIL